MPRSLFARFLSRSLLVFFALLLAFGVFLDRFLIDREVSVLESHLARYGRLATEGLDLQSPSPGLQDSIRDRGISTGIRFTIIAEDGTVLADSHHDPSTMDDHSTRPEISSALSGRTGRSIRESPTLGLEMLYVALPGDPVVRAAMPLLDVNRYVWQVRRRVLWAVIPGALLSLGLAYYLARSLTHRLQRMTEAASQLAEGDYEIALSVSGNDELSDLERNLAVLRNELAEQVGALQRDRERLRSLLDTLPEAVLLLDGERRLSVANIPARELLRFPEHRLLGLPGAELLREPKILEALDTLTREKALPGTAGESFRVHWSEPRRDLEVTLCTLPDEQGRPGVLVVLRDITHQVHLEKVRTDFIANLSHELRTPLTAIRGAAETLQDGALEQPAAAGRFLETIRRHSIRLENLLSDVSDLARVEAGAAANDLCRFDATSPARQALDLFGAEADRQKVSLRSELPEEPLDLTSDPSKVESILVNLLQNAVRYTPEGGTVNLSVEPGRDGVNYRVADTGIGIPPKDLSRVTERFYRVDPSRSRAHGGTGLGLSIVKHLVEDLGGHLAIESDYGKGTRVLAHLPDLSPEPDKAERERTPED